MEKLQTARQTTDTILMVRPARFGFNEQTAGNNAFQKRDDDLSDEEVRRRALAEFDAFVDKLRDAGVRVIVVEDTDEPEKPDSVFPNNWVSFHEDGYILTYPMFAGKRRHERREDLLRQLSESFGFEKRIHLEQYEVQGRYLEGTGSMILDRENRLAYACRSVRTDIKVLEAFSRIMGFEAVLFTAVDTNGLEIYHTNVMMALGETFVVICLETVKDDRERLMLMEKFDQTGKEVIEISYAQMMAFAGNMLQVRSQTGEKILVMSEQAFLSLSGKQIEQIGKHTSILHSPLYTIETFGGGSARCMMAEVFYPDPGSDEK